MSSKLDKSLDEISSENKKTGGGGRGGRRGGRGGRTGGGSGRRNQNGSDSSSYQNPLSRGDDDESSSGPVRRQRRQNRDTPGYGGGGSSRADGDWGHDRFDTNVRGSSSVSSAPQTPSGPRLEAGTKVLVANLDPSVGADDIKEIFQNLGNVVKAIVHYDQNSRSLGTAEVTFSNLATATQAVAEYDGAEVDGRPMTLKLLAGVAPPPRNVVTKRRERVTQPSGGPRRQLDDRRTDRRDRQDRGDRQDRPRKEKEEMTPVDASALDKEMDSYQSARGGATSAPAAGQPSAPAATASE